MLDSTLQKMNDFKRMGHILVARFGTSWHRAESKKSTQESLLCNQAALSTPWGQRTRSRRGVCATEPYPRWQGANAEWAQAFSVAPKHCLWAGLLSWTPREYRRSCAHHLQDDSPRGRWHPKAPPGEDGWWAQQPSPCSSKPAHMCWESPNQVPQEDIWCLLAGRVLTRQTEGTREKADWHGRSHSEIWAGGLDELLGERPGSDGGSEFCPGLLHSEWTSKQHTLRSGAGGVTGGHWRGHWPGRGGSEVSYS